MCISENVKIYKIELEKLEMKKANRKMNSLSVAKILTVVYIFIFIISFSSR